MRYLIVPAMLIGLASATSTTAASNVCSNDMSMRADESLVSAAGAWGSLFGHWRTFSSCDDGGIAEGYSDAVVVLLARRWDQFDAFVSLSERNPTFRKWAIGHIDATTSSDDLKQVLRNTARCAGSIKRKDLCREIAIAAKDALKDLSAALFESGAASVITPNSVEQMIDRYGAKRTVDKLTNGVPNDIRTDFGDFDKVLDGIASGDSRWLALVPRLEPGTDAGTAESLRIVVAKSLPSNPAGVLRLIVREPSWRDACSYPMIEPTQKEMRAYFKVAIPAVKAIRSMELRRARSVCLAELTSAQHTP